MGLISLLGVKDAVYGSIIVLLIAGGATWYVRHDIKEQKLGEAKVIAAQKAADKKEADHVAKVQASADATAKSLQSRLDTELLAPVHTGVVVRLCSTAASVSANAPRRDEGTGSKSDAASGPSIGVGSAGQEGPDIAPGTESILSRDKAVIDYLQGYVRDCQTAGLCAK